MFDKNYLMFTAPFKFRLGEPENVHQKTGVYESINLSFPLNIGKRGRAQYATGYDRDYTNTKVNHRTEYAPFKKRSTQYRPYDYTTSNCPPSKITIPTTKETRMNEITKPSEITPQSSPTTKSRPSSPTTNAPFSAVAQSASTTKAPESTTHTTLNKTIGSADYADIPSHVTGPLISEIFYPGDLGHGPLGFNPFDPFGHRSFGPGGFGLGNLGPKPFDTMFPVSGHIGAGPVGSSMPYGFPGFPMRIPQMGPIPQPLPLYGPFVPDYEHQINFNGAPHFHPRKIVPLVPMTPKAIQNGCIHPF